MLNARHRAVAIAALALLAAPGIAACSAAGSSGNSGGQGTNTGTSTAASSSHSTAASSSQSTAASSSPSASADPLAALTADQIALRAMTNTKSAPSVRITATTSDSGQTLKFDLLIERGQGCQGTIEESKSGSFRLIEKGTNVWILPDAKFYRSVGGTNSAALAILSGKYLKEKTTGSGLGALATLCQLSGLLGGFNFNTPAGLTRSAAVPIDGQPAVNLSDSGDTAHMYVSDTASPEVLRVDDPGSGGGVLNFRYGAPVAITAPPASEVLDGSKYGF